MITIASVIDGTTRISYGLEQYIVEYVKAYGHITSLDRWANELGVSPDWARHCAHSAARKKLVKLTRLDNAVGQPYQVTIFGGGEA